MDTLKDDLKYNLTSQEFFNIMLKLMSINIEESKEIFEKNYIKERYYDTREYSFLNDLFLRIQQKNIIEFTNLVKLYSRYNPITNYQVSLLLRVKNNIN